MAHHKLIPPKVCDYLMNVRLSRCYLVRLAKKEDCTCSESEQKIREISTKKQSSLGPLHFRTKRSPTAKEP